MLLQKTNEISRVDVFVGSLPPDTTKDDLRSVFSKLGQVGEITLKSNERYAFISFNNCQG